MVDKTITFLFGPNFNKKLKHFDRFRNVQFRLRAREQWTEDDGDRMTVHLVTIRMAEHQFQVIHQECDRGLFE